jgi:hypothetical protein
MYADNTTLYVIGPTVDIVTFRLNKVLGKFYNWCTFNSLIPHPGKTEYMLIGKKKIHWSTQRNNVRRYCIKRVHSKRCLGMEVDDDLKWVKHILELTQSFSQKINLLKSLYFLPTKARLDFYYKVVFPLVIYGLVVWGSTNKTQFDNLERMHVRAAKFIFDLDWNTPTEEVRTKYNCTYLKLLVILVHKCYYGKAPFKNYLLNNQAHTILEMRTVYHCQDLKRKL